MQKIIESKARFTEGGDVFFENNAAQELYNKMFSAYKAKLRNFTTPLDFSNLEESMKEPSPYDMAEQAGYKWGLTEAETPEYIVKISKVVKTTANSSYHTATFYKK